MNNSPMHRQRRNVRSDTQFELEICFYAGINAYIRCGVAEARQLTHAVVPDCWTMCRSIALAACTQSGRAVFLCRLRAARVSQRQGEFADRPDILA